MPDAWWMPLCGQGWAGTGTSFIGMWMLMMVPMMLPSLWPTLWRRAGVLRGRGIAAAGAGYLLAWVASGALVFVLGVAVTQALLEIPGAMRAAPWLAALVVLLAGAYQFSRFKARQLLWCRMALCRPQCAATAAAAWRYGLELGVRCNFACAGLTAILLVMGMMDWRVMALVTAAITAERLAPSGERVAWAAGAVSIAVGIYLVVRPALPS